MMIIRVDKTKPEELDILQHMESEAFKVNEKYFEGVPRFEVARFLYS